MNSQQETVSTPAAIGFIIMSIVFIVVIKFFFGMDTFYETFLAGAFLVIIVGMLGKIIGNET